MSGEDAPRLSDRELARQLAGEVATVRDELGTLVAELDRRRHEILDLPRQIKQHASEIALAGLAVAAAVSVVIWLVVRRSGRSAAPGPRVGHLREAVARMTEHPERVTESPSIASQIIGAAATAAAVTVTRTLLGEGLERLLDHRRRAAARAPDQRPEPS